MALGFPPLGVGGFAGSSVVVPPSPVTDYFNGFELSGSTYSGGPTVVADNDGTLVTSPAGVLPIEGMRWATTVAEGATLGDDLFTGFTAISGWVDNGDGSYTRDDDADEIAPAQSGIFTDIAVGTRFQHSVTLSNVTAGTIRQRAGAFSDYITSDGDYVIELVYDGSNGSKLFITDSAFRGTVKINSIREVIPQWLDTDLSGDLIHPSTPLRTRKGTVSVYDESYKGPLIEPARTNKLICRKSEPVDLTNIAVDSGSPTNLTLVDMSEVLLSSGLSHLCVSGMVYRLDNSTNAANRYARCVGLAGNTNPHTMSAYICGTGKGGVRKSGLSGAGSVENIALTDNFVRVSDMGNAAAIASEGAIVANPYSVVYFILPQFEEGTFATSPIALDSTGADPLTSLTRPAANLTRPTAGTALAALNNWAIRARFRPTAAGQTAVLWGSYTDADNATRLDLAPTTLTFTKRLAGANHVAQASLTHAADTLYEALIYQHSVHGMGIATRSWSGSAWSAWSTWVDLTDANGIANASIAATYQNGAVNNSSHVCANMPFVSVIALPASVEPQAWLMSQLANGRV